mmetsp:Transcript_2075/g.4478  ORF Transcript_2075/g.4478 Transcript_2075/m.4478 type:complete len:286 (+) Transcript_2075:866-1723(+)
MANRFINLSLKPWTRIAKPPSLVHRDEPISQTLAIYATSVRLSQTRFTKISEHALSRTVLFASAQFNCKRSSAMGRLKTLSWTCQSFNSFVLTTSLGSRSGEALGGIAGNVLPSSTSQSLSSPNFKLAFCPSNAKDTILYLIFLLSSDPSKSGEVNWSCFNSEFGTSIRCHFSSSSSYAQSIWFFVPLYCVTVAGNHSFRFPTGICNLIEQFNKGWSQSAWGNAFNEKSVGTNSFRCGKLSMELDGGSCGSAQFVHVSKSDSLNLWHQNGVPNMGSMWGGPTFVG